MPFGLTNVSATFQALINDVMRPFLRQFVLVFCDDILIYSQSWSKHLHHVHLILTKLQEHRLFIQEVQVFIWARFGAYLGYVISANGVEMDAQKVQAVRDWPTPRSARAVREFMRLARYYRWFVKDFGTIATPLTCLLCKESFKWNTDAEAAFQA
jgi:hypothetical protein